MADERKLNGSPSINKDYYYYYYYYYLYLIKIIFSHLTSELTLDLKPESPR